MPKLNIDFSQNPNGRTLKCCEPALIRETFHKHYYQWRIQGGGGGAQQARGPLKLDQLCVFLSNFVSECLKIRLR